MAGGDSRGGARHVSALNVGATPERVDVYLFAANLEPKSLDLFIQQNLLTISGTRNVEVNEKAQYYRRERLMANSGA